MQLSGAMFPIPSTVHRLRERQPVARKVRSTKCLGFGLPFLLVLLLLPTTSCSDQVETGGLPFPESQTVLHSSERTTDRDGDRPTYATSPHDTQSLEIAHGGDHKSAARLDGGDTIDDVDAVPVTVDTFGKATVAIPNESVAMPERGQTGELELPNYESSSVRSASPPVYKYTDNVFRVPKRKAKKSYPETPDIPVERKSVWNRSGGTGRVRSTPVELAAEGSSASVAYAEGHTGAVGRLFYDLPGGGQETLFQLFTNLFDHGNWNILELKARIGEQCAAHVGLYLRDLRHQRGWALKGKQLLHNR